MVALLYVATEVLSVSGVAQVAVLVARGYCICLGCSLSPLDTTNSPLVLNLQAFDTGDAPGTLCSARWFTLSVFAKVNNARGPLLYALQIYWRRL